MPQQGSRLGIVVISGAFMLAILALLFVISELAYSLNEWMVTR